MVTQQFDELAKTSQSIVPVAFHFKQGMVSFFQFRFFQFSLSVSFHSFGYFVFLCISVGFISLFCLFVFHVHFGFFSPPFLVLFSVHFGFSFSAFLSVSLLSAFCFVFCSCHSCLDLFGGFILSVSFVCCCCSSPPSLLWFVCLFLCQGGCLPLLSNPSHYSP